MSSLNISISIGISFMLMLMSRLSSLAHKLLMVMIMLKPGSHLCDKHNRSDISIRTRKKEHKRHKHKHKHKKKGACSFFLVLMLMLMSLVLCLSDKCEPGFVLALLALQVRTGLKSGSHLCNKHKTSEISISISTRKKEHDELPFWIWKD